MIANVYLNFNGNCEEAFNFYKTVFNKEFTTLSRFKEMPASEHSPKMQAEDADKIMHVSLKITDNSVIMGSDTGAEWSKYFVQGNNFSISLNVDSTTEADKIFNALSAGGHITMPMNKTFWGDYFGMCTDKFGINWMLSYNENPQQK